MERTARPFSPFTLFRSAALGAVMAMALFQVMHSVIRLDEAVSGVILGLMLIPALATGLVRQVATLLSDPDGHLPTIVFAFANILVAIVFFALVYLELGIYAADEPGRDVASFLTCLYFSASIITTTGLGDFVPRPETRFIAAVQMIFGYFAFGIVTAATFFLLVHRSRKDAAG